MSSQGKTEETGLTGIDGGKGHEEEEGPGKSFGQPKSCGGRKSTGTRVAGGKEEGKKNSEIEGTAQSAECTCHREKG